MKKIYHMVIENKFTGERKEYISGTQGKAPPGWQVVGVCGYHESERKNAKENNNGTTSYRC